MNQSKAKALRKVFVPPFPVNDPRNKAYFRIFKKEYNKMPRPLRAEFLANLKKVKELSDNSAE